MYKWVEIDLSAINKNYQLVREIVAPEVKVLAVVKADAYGHGLVEVAKELEAQRVDYLGVTEIDEGIQLREQGLITPILVFSPFLLEEIPLALEYNLTITVADLRTLEHLKAKEIFPRVHLKIETGLGRTGFKLAELEEAIKLIHEGEIKVEGVYTHLATAMWDNSDFVKKQFAEFTKAIDFLQANGLEIELRHICNSAALLKFPHYHLDMVRAGNIIYGHSQGQLALHNPWRLKSQITYINQLPKGHSVGYERAHILKRDSRLAIIPVGISHGFSIEPVVRSNNPQDLLKSMGKLILRYLNHPKTATYVTIKDTKVPVVGKVGMQLTIIDITDAPEIDIGDIVELTGRRTNISSLLPRVFIKSGQVIKVRRFKEDLEEVRIAAK